MLSDLLSLIEMLTELLGDMLGNSDKLLDGRHQVNFPFRWP